MGKRKADSELERFVWKRNIRYDIQLLSEVELFNPYASKNQKLAWDLIVETLQEHPVPMNVTSRCCRDRVTDLLRSHRKGERLSIQTFGVGEETMTALQTLLTSVSKLEEAKPDKMLKNLYSTQDREKAVSVRDKVLEEVVTDSSDSENGKKSSYTSTDEKSNDDFEFGPTKGKTVRNSNPKKDLVNYLEAKNKADLVIRKEELRIRDEEMVIKNKEMEIKRMCGEAEIEERKKMMELLTKLANPAGK